MNTPASPPIQVRFERSPACAVIPASGVIGSGTSDGQVSLQFYIERSEPPKSVTVEQRGSTVVQVGHEPSTGGVRHVLAELVISPQAAYMTRSIIDQLFKVMGIDPAKFDPVAFKNGATGKESGESK